MAPSKTLIIEPSALLGAVLEAFAFGLIGRCYLSSDLRTVLPKHSDTP